jgi:hypothetical protein
MPTWNEINEEIGRLTGPDPCDTVRQKYLGKLEALTGRAVIAYYSGFLQKRLPDGRTHPEAAITDLDINGLMATIHGLDRTRGLDLILHTPGGGIEATRSIVSYLNKQFGLNVRAIVPHMAMSAGTMIACACNEIVLAKHSCLGPTDPQVRGLPALGILAEVERAIEEIKAEPLKQLVWQQIFSKYPPAFILDCERSVSGSKKLVQAWLRSNMFLRDASRSQKAKRVVSGLTNYKKTTEHGHHFTFDKCRSLGLKVKLLEDDQAAQEAVLSVHHSFVATFARTPLIKIIENAHGQRWVVREA